MWRCRAYGSVALMACLIELLGIWGTTAITAQLSTSSSYSLVRSMAWLYVAGLASIPIAVIGIFRDAQRTLARVALALGLINIVVCGIRFLAA